MVEVQSHIWVVSEEVKEWGLGRRRELSLRIVQDVMRKGWYAQESSDGLGN